MSGIIIERNKIEKKTRERNEELERAIEAAKQTVKAMTACDTEELQGAAWDGIRLHIQEVQEPLAGLYCCWVKEQIEANRQYSSAASSLSCRTMDEERFRQKLEEYRRALAEEENKKIFGPSQAKINFYNALIDLFFGYLQEIDHFAITTQGQYDNAERYQGLLAQADEWIVNDVNLTEIKSVDYSEPGKSWLLQLMENEVEDRLKSMGIDYESDDIKDMNISPIQYLWILEEMEKENAYTIEKVNGKNKIKFYDMEELDYTYGDIIYTWSMLTPAERPFMAKLIIGTEESYKEAFQTDPNDLFGVEASGKMDDFLVEYSCKLFDKDIERLEKFTNGIFNCTKLYECQVVDSWGAISYSLTSLMYAEVYLDVLSDKTQNMLDGTTAAYVDGKCRYEKFSQMRHMCNYWCSIEQVTTDRHNKLDNWTFRIEFDKENTPEVRDASFKYDLKYYSSWEQEYRTDNVTLVLLDNETLRNKLNDKKREELEKELKQLWIKHLMSFASAGVSDALVGSVTRGLPSNIAGVGGIVVGGGKEFVSYQKDMHETQAEIDWDIEKEKLEILGAGGMYTVTSKLDSKVIEPTVEEHITYVGFYHAENMKRAKKVEKGGVSKAKNMPYDTDVTDIINKIGVEEDAEIKDGNVDKDYNKARALLLGGYPLLEKVEIDGQMVYRFKDFYDYEETRDLLNRCWKINPYTTTGESVEDGLW